MTVEKIDSFTFTTMINLTGAPIYNLTQAASDMLLKTRVEVLGKNAVLEEMNELLMQKIKELVELSTEIQKVYKMPFTEPMPIKNNTRRYILETAPSPRNLIDEECAEEITYYSD